MDKVGYILNIYIDNENAIRLLLKHRFIKVKRHWELPGGGKFSTQDALQALITHIVTIELEGKKRIKLQNNG